MTFLSLSPVVAFTVGHNPPYVLLRAVYVQKHVACICKESADEADVPAVCWPVVKIEQFTFRVWTAIWTSSGQFVLRPEPVSNIKPRRTAPLPHDRDSHGFTEKPIQCNRRKNLPVQEVNMQLTCGYQKADHTGPPQSPG
ncbi:hypothetical protein Bbelb_415790 [Branchiostoma belcheri]|nr:hypothetical protein Bbelb_415790 [Branchiostoma belcheri]